MRIGKRSSAFIEMRAGINKLLIDREELAVYIP